jgi:magnesium-transporting ATPase (P-type)
MTIFKWKYKVGCSHPVACTRSGSGFPSNATLFWTFYSVTATCFGLMTIFRWKYIWSRSGFPSNATLVWILYSVTATCFGLMTIFKRNNSNQCCVRREPWTWLLVFTRLVPYPNCCEMSNQDAHKSQIWLECMWPNYFRIVAVTIDTKLHPSVPLLVCLCVTAEIFEVTDVSAICYCTRN